MNVALEHLLLRLRPLHRALRRATDARGALSEYTVAKGVQETCVTREDARLLLEHLDRRVRDGRNALDLLELEPAEAALEKLLRARANDAGIRLPLDALRDEVGLDPVEAALLLAIVAPHIDASYELVYGYVVDDLARRFASVELLRSVLAQGIEAELELARRLAPSGPLRLRGLIEEAPEPCPTERHVVLRPTRRALAFVLGQSAAPHFVDPFEVSVSDAANPPGVSADALGALAAGLRSGAADVVGVWGSASSARDSVVRVLAARAELRLRRIDPAEVERSFALAEDGDAMLWVDTDALSGRALEPVLERARSFRTRLCLSGTHALYPVSLVLSRRFGELRVREPNLEERALLWRGVLPELTETTAEGLASRIRIDAARMRAAARLAEAQAALSDDSRRGDHLEAAVAAIVRAPGNRFTTLIEPRRKPDDLVLPAGAHRAVMEVATFFRATALVGERWGMGRMLTGGGGIKALFTGDSGTGKTLAAEVIAGELGLPLLRVDLASVVSKWVGETEQNLEVAFREAEASHAVLFFDEADALFGKRGNVQKGSDRYANLEVSYLLQRLEDYAGVAVLATNLRENVDKAFARRFQVVVHFPRPGADERKRIWRRAFPPQAPLADNVDLGLLSQLDMTGASIVSSARVAALLAAERGQSTIGMKEVVSSIARQFQREARVLTPRDLGPHACLLEG